jgi:pimeloyl-ACP methyl ester carboxylesterase
MPSLDVPGASLYYEALGKGPLLLLIPGADGRGSVFHPIAQRLAAHFTVICWDRRGYSRSYLKGAQDFADRLITDAHDAFRLIRHLSPEQAKSTKAVVFGTSSGAIVAQSLLLRHPDCVERLVIHEPPAFNVLPAEFQRQGAGLINHIYDVYRANGPIEAMRVFTEGLSEGKDAQMMRECMNHERSDEIRANSLFWFEFELRQYPLSEVDLDGIRRAGEKIVPAAGIDSGDGPGVGPIAVIAKVVGKDIARLPGGHVGYMTDPEDWAQAFCGLVRERM